MSCARCSGERLVFRKGDFWLSCAPAIIEAAQRKRVAIGRVFIVFLSGRVVLAWNSNQVNAIYSRREPTVISITHLGQVRFAPKTTLENRFSLTKAPTGVTFQRRPTD